MARVRLIPGDGKMTVNGRPSEEYFGREILEMIMRRPFEMTGTSGRYDVVVRVDGGGGSGQAGAVRHGIARALLASDSSLRQVLRREGFLTRDSRMKERKKYGQKGARAKFQWTKR